MLLHSGGWKKLTAQAVTKEEFSRRIGGRARLPDPRQILDFYGMVEQVGTVLVDCEAGTSTPRPSPTSSFAAPARWPPSIRARRASSKCSARSPTSYPGQALLTEDQGVLVGVDDCPCGRKGGYFRFASRIEQAEVRGCGDIFAQARDIR